MFHPDPTESGKTYRLAVAGLLLLSVAAFVVTLWVMADFVHEQAILEKIIQALPQDSRDPAVALMGELRWQFQLTILIVLNLVVTGITIALLWRAYRASQASLRDIKALASDVLSCMEQAVVTTDIQGNITSANRRGQELLKIDTGSIGRPLGEIQVLPLQEFVEKWRVGPSFELPRKFSIKQDGMSRKLHVFCQALKDSAGCEVGNVLQVHDVTERSLIEERMLRMERYMGMGSLAAGLHHEIKNPLAALSLHAQLLEERVNEGRASDSFKQMLGVMRSEIGRIGKVLESFQDLVSLGQLSCSDVTLSELIRQQIELLRPQAARNHIRIEFHDGNAGAVFADRVRLEQVLLNLLVNAMDAMSNGGTLTIFSRGDERQAQIEVRDTGRGIPKSLQEKVFDPYFTTKSGGTGLGLAISDKIMRQHAGNIEFTSSPEGTTFRMTLPRLRFGMASGGTV